jgi:hypothetical protein
VKGFAKSGIANTGAEHIAPFRVREASSASLSHLKAFFFKRLVSGLLINP